MQIFTSGCETFQYDVFLSSLESRRSERKEKLCFSERAAAKVWWYAGKSFSTTEILDLLESDHFRPSEAPKNIDPMFSPILSDSSSLESGEIAGGETSGSSMDVLTTAPPNSVPRGPSQSGGNLVPFLANHLYAQNHQNEVCQFISFSILSFL